MCDGMVAAETRASVPTSPADRLLLSLLFFLAVVSPGQASECVRPPSVQHSWVNLTETNRGSFPLGTLLQYSCDSGYMLDGPSTISCTASGRWSADPPHCVRTNVCRKPFEPENGGYTCHPSPCHRLTPGTVIEYFCDEGYALKGDYKYLTCQNGEWDSPMQISCVLDTERGPYPQTEEGTVCFGGWDGAPQLPGNPSCLVRPKAAVFCQDSSRFSREAFSPGSSQGLLPHTAFPW
ncbi:hypothetical protein ANANG_G00021180 [Anguilla anguilla]|uniref:Sushi domain-containing protein n=1 Tax=Anguilla anguilla TaxID=7936 RepID=A0A9D3N1I3_ANGAN|nr:hypothetical protein ANANG_G00021180 [Anguilla anguilla]